jgi:probable F420-dependent oxidoreductase
MTHPFRFGLQVSSFPPQEWRKMARRVEELGYSTLFFPDHFRIQWEPATALAVVAGATERLRVGALVYDIDYRHPVIYAKAAATLHIMSGGRHEFGLGAGWMETDYVEAGLPYDRAGVRIERLEEALQIIFSMWSEEHTSFEGRHYTIREIAQAAALPQGERPRVLIGGGGKKILGLAGRYADIVGINPKVHEGKVTADTPRDLAPERVREKVGWMRAGAEAAGRNPDEIELNSLTFVTAITDDPKPVREGLAANTGMTVEQVTDCPLFLTGPGSEICDQLEKRREETGISYVVIQSHEADMSLVEAFAKEVVEPLAGR